MLRAAILFFIIGLLSFALGAGNIGGLSVEIGKLIFIGFLVLSVVSVALSFLKGGKGSLKALAFALSATLLAGVYPPAQAVAEETTVEKVENKLDDAQTAAKIQVRKQKKAIREATGNESLKEDARDAALNAQDRISNEARKIKRKLD